MSRIVFTEEESRRRLGEKLFNELKELNRLTQNNEKRLTEIAKKYRGPDISDERILQVLNATDEDNIVLTKEEVKYLGPLNLNMKYTIKD